MNTTYAHNKAAHIIDYFGKPTVNAWAIGHPNGYVIESTLNWETSADAQAIADVLKQTIIRQSQTCSASGGYDWAGSNCGHCGKAVKPTKSGAIRKHKSA